MYLAHCYLVAGLGGGSRVLIVMRILHTADLQLGARFSQFAGDGEYLRSVRLETLRGMLRMAEERGLDGVVIAGDLFDDNQVSRDLSKKALEVLGERPGVRVFIIPGNHDPYTGPGCIWETTEWVGCPPNIVVFREATVVECGDGVVVGAPLHQKVSLNDPSRKLGEVLNERGVGPGIPVAGFTHGSPDIPGMRSDNDFPISLDGAHRDGLDYLGVGHWHGWQHWSEKKLLMPGTPEPDSFDQRNSGWAAIVNVRSGEMPEVEKIQVRKLDWVEVKMDLNAGDAGVDTAVKTASELGLENGNTVLRMILDGVCGHELRQRAETEALAIVERCRVGQVVDRSHLVLSRTELDHLSEKSPVLAQVVTNLMSIRPLCMDGIEDDSVVGGMRVSEVIPSGGESGNVTISFLEQICGDVHLTLSELKSEDIRMALNLVFEFLREGRV